MSYDQSEFDFDLTNLTNLIADMTALPPPTALVTPTVQPKALNTKAMSVQLVTRKPTTSRRDEVAEKVAQDALGDNAITATSRLFKDKTNPVRALINEANAVYQYHKTNTLPYIDRGPRLLPVTMYESYRDAMRVLTAEVTARVTAIAGTYTACVSQDIAFRNRPDINGVMSTRARVEDYPTAEEFAAAFDITFTFAPLPDNSHWLFDIDDEDRAALTAQSTTVYAAALADMRERITAPLTKLIETLQTEAGTDPVTGKRVGIFRDTTVTNVTDAVAMVRSLSMGDEDVLAACDAVSAALPKEITTNIDVLRGSPVVREAAAKKLADVASKMGVFFGG